MQAARGVAPLNPGSWRGSLRDWGWYPAASIDPLGTTTNQKKGDDAPQRHPPQPMHDLRPGPASQRLASQRVRLLAVSMRRP